MSDYLIKKGFLHYSVSGYIIELLDNEGMEVNRDSLVKKANELREKNSPSYLVEQLFEKALKNGKDCIIESIRTVGEIESLREKGNFVLFAVDADIKTRYSRIIERKSKKDSVSFEKFEADEKLEMESDDPNKQNLSECIGMADYVFMNDSTIEELNKKIDEVLEKL